MSNIAPIFPLPNVVFFPGIALPLHIFEKRYQNMINDLNDYDNNLIISFGYRSLGDQMLPSKISSIGKVSKIQNYKDGKKDILVVGHDYVKIETPTKTDGNYLVAKYTTYKLTDDDIKHKEEDIKINLIKNLHLLALLSLNFSPNTLGLMNKDLSLDNLVNRIIFYYLYPSSEQQKLLEMKSITNKCNYIKTYLTVIQNELKSDLKGFRIPKNMVKKLN